MAGRKIAGEGDVRYDQMYNRYIWQGTIVLMDGQKKRTTITGKSEEEVVEKKRKLLSDEEQGKAIAKNKTTVEQWSNLWLEQYKKLKLAPNTFSCYKTFFDYHINKHIGKVELQKLTTSDVQVFIAKVSRKLAASSVKKIYIVLLSCIDQAMKEGRVSKNVVRNVVIPKQSKSKKRKVLSNDDLKKLLTVAYNEYQRPNMQDNKTFYPALIVAIETGIRRSELLGLKWTSIDFNTKMLYIHEALIEAPTKPMHKGELKNESSVRYLPISDYSIELLKSIERNCEYVFSTKNKQPINPRFWTRKFHQWCSKAGLKFSPHDLRHTFITDMVNSGESITSIQSFTGHANPTVLLNNYAHIVSEEKLNTARRKHERMKGVIPDASKNTIASNTASK